MSFSSYCMVLWSFLPLPPTDSEAGMVTVNRCLDAAKACNVDDLCQKLRTEYVSACIKPSAKSGLCNKAKCSKALRRFFDRIPPDYTHELLFCPCTDTACAERRRQTIVPGCSFEGSENPAAWHRCVFARLTMWAGEWDAPITQHTDLYPLGHRAQWAVTAPLLSVLGQVVPQLAPREVDLCQLISSSLVLSECKMFNSGSQTCYHF